MKVRAEHRTSCRYRTDSPCRLGVVEGGRLLLHRARLADVSLSGGKVFSPIFLPVGTVVQLTVDSVATAAIYVRIVRSSPLKDGRYLLGVCVIDGNLPYNVFCDLAFRANVPPEPESEPEVDPYKTPEPPKPFTPSCLVELGLTLPCTAEEVRQAFREQAKTAHPDHGGEVTTFIRLRAAYYDSLEYLGGAGLT